jgi:hypothetical protein
VSKYGYSPDGLRQVKVANGVTTHYVFEGTESIFEKRISDSRVRSYVYALGKHLARLEGKIGDTTAKVYYYHLIISAQSRQLPISMAPKFGVPITCRLDSSWKRQAWFEF